VAGILKSSESIPVRDDRRQMEEDDTAELHVLPRRAEMWEASSRSLGKQ